MNLYSLINNYETSNKYTKYLSTCAHLFNVMATIIRVRGLRILYIKYFKVGNYHPQYQTLKSQQRTHHPLSRAWEKCGRSPWLIVNILVINILTYATIWS
jgi:hypothetical protein